jgi:DNA-binding response OmpR family regulator
LNKQNKKKRILVVDDEPDNCSIFTITLEDNGFDIDSYTNTLLALSAFKPNSYDLLVLDIKIPKMNYGSILSKGIHNN